MILLVKGEHLGGKGLMFVNHLLFFQDDRDKKDPKKYQNDMLNDHEKDKTSHFILRLAYCRS